MTITLIRGDCLEVMQTLKPESIDAVITDPPYGLLFRGMDWDDHIPTWIDAARRISEKVIFTTAPTTMWDYPRPDWVCDWHRRAAASRTAQGGFNHWSPILVYGDVKFSVDYYETAFGRTVSENRGIEHPSPNPVELYKWILREATGRGDTILDPFMGSGTTGVACVKTGRNFIGIEIDPGYFEIATNRIKEAQMQPRLGI